MNPPSPARCPLPLRAAAVPLLATAVTAAAALLSWLAQPSLPGAALTALGTFGGARSFVDSHLAFSADGPPEPEAGDAAGAGRT
jgi:hypothetical protein